MKRLKKLATLSAFSFLSLMAVVRAESVPVLAPKQNIPALATAQTVLVEATTLTREGFVDPSPVVKVVVRRMEALGYRVITNPAHPHEVVVQVTCQEPQTTEKDLSVRGNNSSIPPTLHLSAGPPCLLGYVFDGHSMKWQRIDRIVYTDGVQAAKEAAADFMGVGAMTTFIHYLERYEFPLLLSAEWGQVDRLRSLLDAPDTDRRYKLKIISLLGEIQAEPAFNCIVDALRDESLIVEATRALGNFGALSKPVLMTLLKTSRRSDVQATAASSLGKVGARTGDPSMTPFLLDMLKTPGIDMAVQIEIVWALGKSPDFQAHPALEELERRIWSVRSQDPQLQKLREAVEWSIREVRQGDILMPINQDVTRHRCGLLCRFTDICPQR